MKEYDETVYNPAIRVLQDECETEGHIRGRADGINPAGRAWWMCGKCGKRFSGIKTAKFCSNACRQRAKYARKKRSDD